MRNIVIPHQGPILPKGGIYGPINNPYRETDTIIKSLLIKNIPVFEVLDDGSRVELSLKSLSDPLEITAATPEKVVETAPVSNSKEDAKEAAKAKAATEAAAKAEAERVQREAEEAELERQLEEEEKALREAAEKKEAEEASKVNTNKKNITADDLTSK